MPYINHTLHILKNGLKVILMRIPTLSSVTLAIAIRSGPHFECKEVNGVSHFLEHIIFRGSKKRKSKAMLYEPIESCGARMGGSTKRECTIFYVQGIDSFLQTFMDVLFDAIFNPLFLDIDTEKKVILKEMDTYSGVPMRLGFQKLCSFFYPNHPFSLPVLGTKESVYRMHSSTLMSWHRKFYRNLSSIAIAISGNFSTKSVLSWIKANTPPEEIRSFFSVQKTLPKSRNGPMIITQSCDKTVATLCLGFLEPVLEDSKIEIFELINVLLGGYTNSRICRKLRANGLAYRVFSKEATFHGWGLLTIIVETSIEQVISVTNLIVTQLNDLKNNTLSDKELQLVKNVFEGQIKLQLNDYFQSAIWGAEEALKRGTYRLPNLIVDKVHRITAQDIQKLAKGLFVPTNACYVIVEPMSTFSQEDILKILDYLS